MVSFGTFVSQLVDSITKIGPKFADVAGNDPIGAILLAFGALFVFAAVVVFGILTLGALVDLITPDVSGRRPPRGVR